MLTRNYFKYKNTEWSIVKRIQSTKQKKIVIVILISNRLDFKARNTTRDKETHLTFIKRAIKEVGIYSNPKIK